MDKLKTFRIVVPALALVFCSWGSLVHRTTQQIAVYELPVHMRPFFYKNMESLVRNAVRADKRRNIDKKEAAKHFIDFEGYGDSAAYKMPLNWKDAIAKYSKDTLEKYGYVPYVIIAE